MNTSGASSVSAASSAAAYSCTSYPMDVQSLPPNLVVSSCGVLKTGSNEIAKFGSQQSEKAKVLARWKALNQSAFESIVEGQAELAAAKWLDALELIEFEPYTDERLTKNLDCLVQAFLLLRMYKEATKFCLRSLEIKRVAYDQWDLRVADCLNDLAGIHYRDKNFDKVEKCCLEAEQIYIKVQGNESAHVASLAANLAIFYHSQGRNIEAQKRYQQAIKIRKNLVPEGHASLITLYEDYARLLTAMGCN